MISFTICLCPLGYQVRKAGLCLSVTTMSSMESMAYGKYSVNNLEFNSYLQRRMGIEEVK